jgi:hypothetical protein
MTIDTSFSECITEAEDRFATMLADSVGFQEFVGEAGDSVGALEHVHIDAVTPRPVGDAYTLAELATLGNHAIVSTAANNGFTFTQDSISDAYEFSPGGTLEMEIWQQPIDEDDVDDLDNIPRRFKNHVGAILRGITELAGTSGYVDVVRMNVDMITRIDENRRVAIGDQMMAHLTIDWHTGVAP